MFMTNILFKAYNIKITNFVDFSDLLSLAPPNREATLEYTDSYGNPIQTSDGKKVVSAKGIQFEIPNYASGITAIRKPSDNLQPPSSESSESTTPLTQLETLSNSSPVQNYHQSSPTQSFLQLIRSINNRIRRNKGQPRSSHRDILIINKIASKYKTTLPKLEPLAVAEDPVTESPDLVKIPVAPLKEAEDTQKMAASSQISQTIFDESKVPDWIAAFNDPDVGPAQPYIPDPNMGLSVITWGLVPPKDNSDPIEPIKDSAGKVEITKHSVVEVIPVTTTTTTTTRRPTTTTRWTTTSRTTTRRPTTTRTPYTTTRRTTTTTTTTAAPPTNNKETDIYSLENHIQGQIPEWLADYNDTDLASGVPYEIPADLNEVKNTVTLGLIAPLAPFTDIAPLKLPSSLLLSTSTTSTTTKRPISSSFSIPSTTKRTTTTTTTTTKRPTTTRTSTSTTTTLQQQQLLYLP
uniref:Uncharacterized protein n=1 Tax=Megaselia scalaris TaxID=36166 RepID=T1GVE6_MEGSC